MRVTGRKKGRKEKSEPKRGMKIDGECLSSLLPEDQTRRRIGLQGED